MSRLAVRLIVALAAFAVPLPATAAVLGTAEIRVLGLTVDVDTRPDIDGIQTTMTAVKDIPTGVQTRRRLARGQRAAARFPPAPW